MSNTTKGEYEQLMYDIWYDELENKSYNIGTGPYVCMTGKGGYVEFHIAMVKNVNKYYGVKEDTEELFKRLWKEKVSEETWHKKIENATTK